LAALEVEDPLELEDPAELEDPVELDVLAPAAAGVDVEAGVAESDFVSVAAGDFSALPLPARESLR
jgi:hypothetical protein